MLTYDVAIIGGGLGGLVASIQLAQKGFQVALFEKKSYPFHKVCGEYVSKEVLSYFEQLGLQIDSQKPSHISRLLLTSLSGKSLESHLPLGGIGISRHFLDHALYQLALKSGVEVFEKTTISGIEYISERFTLRNSSHQSWHARILIGAHGKRSRIDHLIKRRFISQKAAFVGVKYHREGSFPADLIALHLFPRGYCGISQIEDNKVNMCYLVHTSQLKRAGSVGQMEQSILGKNPFLKDFMERSHSLYENPLVISNISFAAKPAVDQHILMVGDSAGLISPLCGNGMAMAIHSAKIAAECIEGYFQGHYSRFELEKRYQTRWKQSFGTRLKVGKILQGTFFLPYLSELALPLIRHLPSLTGTIIRKTHGHPISS